LPNVCQQNWPPRFAPLKYSPTLPSLFNLTEKPQTELRSVPSVVEQRACVKLHGNYATPPHPPIRALVVTAVLRQCRQVCRQLDDLTSCPLNLFRRSALKLKFTFHLGKNIHHRDHGRSNCTKSRRPSEKQGIQRVFVEVKQRQCSLAGVLAMWWLCAPQRSYFDVHYQCNGARLNVLLGGFICGLSVVNVLFGLSLAQLTHFSSFLCLSLCINTVKIIGAFTYVLTVNRICVSFY